MIRGSTGGKKFLDIQERVRDIPPPDEDHVIVQVRACGVCGTDINFVRDWDNEPMALGHEISARVAAHPDDIEFNMAGTLSLLVNVSGEMETKLQMLGCHESQRQ